MRTVDELIEAAAELDERTAGLFDRLARITARASGEHGVEVTVNLDGKLIALELTDDALRMGADALGAEIYRLTQQASGSALAAGMDLLEPIAGDELAELAELAELIGLPGIQQGFQPPGDPVPPPVVGHPAPAGLTHRGGAVRVGEELAHRVDQGVQLAPVDDLTGDAGQHRLRGAAGVPGHHG